jgi:hypothetical protein
LTSSRQHHLQYNFYKKIDLPEKKLAQTNALAYLPVTKEKSFINNGTLLINSEINKAGVFFYEKGVKCSNCNILSFHFHKKIDLPEKNWLKQTL